MRKHVTIQESVESLVNEIADEKLSQPTDEIEQELYTEETHLYTFLTMLDIIREQYRMKDVTQLYSLLYRLWNNETLEEKTKEEIIKLKNDCPFLMVKNMCDMAYGAIVATFNTEEEIYQ